MEPWVWSGMIVKTVSRYDMEPWVWSGMIVKTVSRYL